MSLLYLQQCKLITASLGLSVFRVPHDRNSYKTKETKKKECVIRTGNINQSKIRPIAKIEYSL